jgi:hypothetical protein
VVGVASDVLLGGVERALGTLGSDLLLDLHHVSVKEAMSKTHVRQTLSDRSCDECQCH